MITALINQAPRFPDELVKSLTWDRGKEMGKHKRFTVATDAAVCFCDPRSPWQRGSNENTNGLLRQYFPNGTLASTRRSAWTKSNASLMEATQDARLCNSS